MADSHCDFVMATFCVSMSVRLSVLCPIWKMEIYVTRVIKGANIDWLVGWLVAWLVGWLIDCLID